MVSLFINTIPVRVNYNDDMSFSQLLREIQSQAIDSEPFHHFPLADIQSASRLKQNLIAHIMAFENFPQLEQIEEILGQQVDDDDRFEFKLASVDSYVFTNYDFYLNVYPGERLEIRFKYNVLSYRRELIEKVAQHFESLIRQVIGDEHIKIGQLSLLSETSKQDKTKQLTDDLEDE